MKFLLSLIIIFTSLNSISFVASHVEKSTISSQQKSISNHHHHFLKNTNKPAAILNGNVIVSSETDDVEDQDNDECSEKSFFKTSIDKKYLVNTIFTILSKTVNSPIQIKRLFILLMVIRI